MKKELEDKLYEKYPDIFKQQFCSIQESSMPWNCQCRSGWYKIIEKLCEDITKICKEKDLTIPQFSCVKEKYGSLRIYAEYIEDEVICDLIEEAEAMSTEICEVCGDKGYSFGTQWFRVRCDKCRKKKN